MVLREGEYFSERLIEFRVGELHRVENFESKSRWILVAIAGSIRVNGFILPGLAKKRKTFVKHNGER